MLTNSLFILCSIEEYVGEIPADKREGVVQQLNEEVKRLIEVVQMHTSLSCLNELSPPLFTFSTEQVCCWCRNKWKGYEASSALV